MNNISQTNKLEKSKLNKNVDKTSAVASAKYKASRIKLIKWAILPLSYACTISLHALLRDLRKAFADYVWNNAADRYSGIKQNDKTGTINVFRAVSLLWNYVFIYIYNSMEDRSSPQNAFYMFSALVVYIFGWYAYPLRNSEAFKNGQPIISYIVGQENLARIQPIWLRGAAANFFVVGIFNCISEIIPQIFISKFWTYFASVDRLMDFKPEERVKENINALSVIGQLIFTIPTLLPEEGQLLSLLALPCSLFPPTSFLVGGKGRRKK